MAICRVNLEHREPTGQIIGAAIRVHSVLGPALLESDYEVCLEHELRKLGLSVRRQVALPIQYDGIALDACYRLDMVVNDRVLLELKSVDHIDPIHEAQLLTCLKLSGFSVGR